MLLNAYKIKVLLLCVVLCVSATSALARVDNNWSRRPNVTVAQQHHGGQAGYRPANSAGYQQPLPTQWIRNNQTNNWQQWQQQNNRTQYIQPTYRPTLPKAAQTNYYRPQQPTYGQGGVLNQTRPSANNYPANNLPQYPIYGQGSLNQTRPTANNYPQHPSKPTANNFPVYPSQGQATYNQSRPSWPQPAAAPQAPIYPQYPSNPQGSLNQTRPAWSQPQPSAPLLPVNSNNRPATNLYPQLPSLNVPQSPSATGNNGIPLAPLQPAAQNPQGPHNWHTGGQSLLSYGPGYYPPPAGNSNKTPSSPQGSSNPYANMFN